MWFSELTIDNVMNIRHRTFKFKCGLVGLFGPNGVGKTTILDCMYVALTNDFNRFYKGREYVINHNSGEKEPAAINAVVQHDQHKLEIFRGLRRPKGHRLIIDEEKEITDANKIAEKIQEILGVDSDILKGYVFKRQNEIFDFISNTDATRKKSFQTLCRAEICEDLYGLLGKKLNSASELRTEALDNSDELTAAIGTLTEERNQLVQERDAATLLLLSDASLQTGAEILSKAKRRKELREESTQKAAEVETLTTEVAEQQTRVDRRKKKRSGLGKLVKKLKTKARAASAALQNWENYETQAAQQKQIRQKLADVEGEEKKKAPKKPEDYIADTKADQKQVTQWETQLDAAKEVDKKFKDDGTVECPTCHTPVKKLAGYLEEQRALVKTLPAKIEALETKIEESETYDNKLKVYEKWKTGYDEKLKSAKEAVERLGELKQPKGDKAKLTALVTRFEKAEEDLTPMRRRVHRAEKELVSKTTKLQEATKRLQEITTELEENEVDKELLARVKKRSEEHEAAQTEVNRLEARIEAKTASIKEKRQDLKAVTIKLERNKKQRKLVKIFERAREVVHYDKLPTQVSQANLALMEYDINKNLEAFNDPFWIEPDENLQFIVHKPGEPAQYAQQLSTGLCVVLAIPFWLSVASLWKTGIGMLALDEPTANLDEENRTYLADALGGLTRKLRGNQQILMTTHAEELKPSFDQVIELDYERGDD